MGKYTYEYPHNYFNDGLSDFTVIYDGESGQYSFKIESLMDFSDKVEGPALDTNDR